MFMLRRVGKCLTNRCSCSRQNKVCTARCRCKDCFNTSHQHGNGDSESDSSDNEDDGNIDTNEIEKMSSHKMNVYMS